MTNTKHWLSIVAIAAVLIAGSLVVSPIAIADDDDDDDNENNVVRDNTTIHSIKLKHPQTMVIIDNAGIGGTSDVEVTWKFDPTKCVLLAAGVGLSSPPIAVVPLANDGALTVPLLPLPVPVPVAHDDIDNLEALLLTAAEGKTCKINPNKGEFVTASTIGSSGPGILSLSHIPGPAP